MNVEQLTERLHATTESGGPDLNRILSEGRRRRARRRAMGAGAALGVAAAVTAPFLVAGMFGQPAETGVATAPDSATYRIADPVGRVITGLNKFYLESDANQGQSSLGLMSVWGERTPAGQVRVHYGWKSEEDGLVRDAGWLLVAGDPSGMVLAIVPSHRAQDTEPTFVVTYPVQAGARARDYALSVESTGADVEIRTRGDVVPGFVMFTVTALARDGGVPAVDFIGLTGPDGLETGLDLHHSSQGWSWSLAG